MTRQVCIDENLRVSVDGKLELTPWSVPRLVRDVSTPSSGEGPLTKPETSLPGKLLTNSYISWTNDTPLDNMIRIIVTRPTRYWITSNPNAIQVRDRWSNRINNVPDVPITSGIYNSQCGSAIDLGTNTVAEPMPGKQWCWNDMHSDDEWVGPIGPGDTLNTWYRCYVWTPPPFSDNANKNAPEHSIFVGPVRIQMIAYPQQGNLVTG